MGSVTNWSGSRGRGLRPTGWFAGRKSFWPLLTGKRTRRSRGGSGSPIPPSAIGGTNGSIRGLPDFTARPGRGDPARMTKQQSPTYFARSSRRNHWRGPIGRCDRPPRRPACRRAPWRACSPCSAFSRIAPRASSSRLIRCSSTRSGTSSASTSIRPIAPSCCASTRRARFNGTHAARAAARAWLY